MRKAVWAAMCLLGIPMLTSTAHAGHWGGWHGGWGVAAPYYSGYAPSYGYYAYNGEPCDNYSYAPYAYYGAAHPHYDGGFYRRYLYYRAGDPYQRIIGYW